MATSFMNEHERRMLDIPQRIKTERLILQIPEPGEGQKIFDALTISAPRLLPWFHWASDIGTLEDSELFVRETQVNFWHRGKFDYMIQLPDNDETLGLISYFNVNWDPVIFGFAYWLRTGYEGKGYMSEAVEAMLTMGYQQLHAHKIFICAESDNEPSQNVARRAGFTYEGTARHYQPSNADKSRMADMCFFSLLRSEWGDRISHE